MQNVVYYIRGMLYPIQSNPVAHHTRPYIVVPVLYNRVNVIIVPVITKLYSILYETLFQPACYLTSQNQTVKPIYVHSACNNTFSVNKAAKSGNPAGWKLHPAVF